MQENTSFENVWPGTHRHYLASAINTLKPCLDDPGDIPGSQLQSSGKELWSGRKLSAMAKPLKCHRTQVTPFVAQQMEGSFMIHDASWPSLLPIHGQETVSNGQKRNMTQLLHTDLKQNLFNHVCLSLPQTQYMYVCIYIYYIYIIYVHTPRIATDVNEDRSDKTSQQKQRVTNT